MEQLKNYCVGIAGAGGLGSNCAVALARCGIGDLILADFDRIDSSNLNRQYYFLDQVGQHKVWALKENLARINPKIIVTCFNSKLDPDSIVTVFRKCDVIVEAFDEATMKTMLIETVLAEMPEMYIVSGSGVAGYGRNNDIHTRQIGKLFVCGDEGTAVSPLSPPLAPKVGIVANMQANQVLEILLNKTNRGDTDDNNLK